MAATEVKAKIGKDGKPVVVKFDFGANMEEAADKYGDEIVFSYYKANATVCIQDVIRSGIKAGKSAQEIQKAVSAWVPGIKRRGKSKSEKMKDDFQKLSEEEKAELLASLTS